jgi:hypothetical protein
VTKSSTLPDLRATLRQRRRYQTGIMPASARRSRSTAAVSRTQASASVESESTTISKARFEPIFCSASPMACSAAVVRVGSSL